MPSPTKSPSRMQTRRQRQANLTAVQAPGPEGGVLDAGNQPKSSEDEPVVDQMDVEQVTSVQEEEVDVGDYKDGTPAADSSFDMKRRVRGKGKRVRIVATFNNRQVFDEAWPGLRRGFHRNHQAKAGNTETWYFLCSKRNCGVRRTVFINPDKVLITESDDQHEGHDRQADLQRSQDQEHRSQNLVYYPEIVTFRPKYVQGHPEDIYLNLFPHQEEEIQYEEQAADQIRPGSSHEDEREKPVMMYMVDRNGTRDQELIVEKEEHVMTNPAMNNSMNSTSLESTDSRRAKREHRLLYSFDSMEEFELAWPQIRAGFHKNREAQLEDGTRKLYYLCSKKGCRVRRTAEFYERKVLIFESTEEHRHEPQKGYAALTEEVKHRILKLYEQRLGPQRIFSILQDEYMTGQLMSDPPMKVRNITDFIYRFAKKRSIRNRDLKGPHSKVRHLDMVDDEGVPEEMDDDLVAHQVMAHHDVPRHEVIVHEGDIIHVTDV